MTTSKRAWFASLLLLCVCSAIAAKAASQGRADTAFDKQFGDAFFDAYWAQHPGYGISVGYYKYADRLIVPDAKAQTEELAFIKKWQTRLHGIDKQALSDSHRADWALLDNEFESRRWDIEQARSWEWNPSNYNVAEPFARILTTEYAPLDQRLRTVLKRLALVPAYYAAAKQNIKNPTREHTQLAIEQNKGALVVFGDALKKQIATSGLSEHERLLITQRSNAAFKPATLQGVQQRCDDARTRSANRMSQRTRAAVDIDARGINPHIAHRCHGHRSKSLVDLVQVNAIGLPRQFFEHLSNCAHWRGRKPFWLVRMACISN